MLARNHWGTRYLCTLFTEWEEQLINTVTSERLIRSSFSNIGVWRTSVGSTRRCRSNSVSAARGIRSNEALAEDWSLELLTHLKLTEQRDREAHHHKREPEPNNIQRILHQCRQERPRAECRRWEHEWTWLHTTPKARCPLYTKCHWAISSHTHQE